MAFNHQGQKSADQWVYLLRASSVYASWHRLERFHRTVQEEFIQVSFRQKLYLTLEELQTDLDEWLVFYNTQGPHLGYRNLGRKPMETIDQYCTQLRENHT